MRVVAVSVVIVSALLSGCGGQQPADRAGRDAPAAAGRDAPAAAGRDCGSYLRSGPDGPGIPAAGLRCFTDALGARQPALLRFTSPSTEGDPIPVTFVARPDGRAEVLTDLRRDRFSAAGRPDRPARGLHRTAAA